MRANAKKIRYAGELNKPIIVNLPDRNRYLGGMLSFGAPSPEMEKEYERDCNYAWDAVYAEMSRRLDILTRHYGTQWPDGAAPLAMRLAFDHVPGFQIVRPPQKRGVRKNGRSLAFASLRIQLMRLRTASPIMTAMPAVSLPVTLNTAKSGVGFPPQGNDQNMKETLESRLHDARRQQRV